jgi:hypothetical protein
MALMWIVSGYLLVRMRKAVLTAPKADGETSAVV